MKEKVRCSVCGGEFEVNTDTVDKNNRYIQCPLPNCGEMSRNVFYENKSKQEVKK